MGGWVWSMGESEASSEVRAAARDAYLEKLQVKYASMGGGSRAEGAGEGAGAGGGASAGAGAWRGREGAEGSVGSGASDSDSLGSYEETREGYPGSPRKAGREEDDGVAKGGAREGREGWEESVSASASASGVSSTASSRGVSRRALEAEARDVDSMHFESGLKSWEALINQETQETHAETLASLPGERDEGRTSAPSLPPPGVPPLATPLRGPASSTSTAADAPSRQATPARTPPRTPPRTPSPRSRSPVPPKPSRPVLELMVNCGEHEADLVVMTDSYPEELAVEFGRRNHLPEMLLVPLMNHIKMEIRQLPKEVQVEIKDAQRRRKLWEMSQRNSYEHLVGTVTPRTGKYAHTPRSLRKYGHTVLSGEASQSKRAGFKVVHTDSNLLARTPGFGEDEGPECTFTPSVSGMRGLDLVRGVSSDPAHARLHAEAAANQKRLEAMQRERDAELAEQVAATRVEMSAKSREITDRPGQAHGQHDILERLYQESFVKRRRTEELMRMQEAEAAADPELTFRPKLSSAARRQHRTLDDIAPTQEELMRVQLDKALRAFERETKDVTFTPEVTETSRRIVAERARKLGVPAGIPRYEHLFQDALRRKARQDEYANWLPEDYTFKPKTEADEDEALRRAVGAKGIVVDRLFEFRAEKEERLERMRQDKARDEMFDPTTGQPLFKPVTLTEGVRDETYRRRPEKPVEQILVDRQAEVDAVLARKKKEQDEHFDSARNTPKITPGSRNLFSKMQRKRLRELFRSLPGAGPDGKGSVDFRDAAVHAVLLKVELETIETVLNKGRPLAAKAPEGPASLEAGAAAGAAAGAEAEAAAEPGGASKEVPPAPAPALILGEAEFVSRMTHRPLSTGFLYARRDRVSARHKDETFRPAISERSRKLAKTRAGGAKGREYLEQMHSQHSEFLKAMESARQEALIKELKACTFKPKLSAASAKLAQRHRDKQLAGAQAFALSPGLGGSPRASSDAASPVDTSSLASPAASLAPGSPLAPGSGRGGSASRLLATAKVARGVGGALAAGYTESFGDTLYRQLESDLRDALTGSKAGTMDAALESLRVEDDTDSDDGSEGEGEVNAASGEVAFSVDDAEVRSDEESEEEEEPGYDEEEAVRRALGRSDAALSASREGQGDQQSVRASDLLEAELARINATMTSPTKARPPVA